MRSRVALLLLALLAIAALFAGRSRIVMQPRRSIARNLDNAAV